MITTEELGLGKIAVQYWQPEYPERYGGLVAGERYTPIAELANWRLVRQRFSGLAPYVTLTPGRETFTLREYENAMPLVARNAIASALYDWTAWTMRHGLGNGIMTALKNGQKEQVLEAIERDLAEAE
jgi:hypothetical protein